MDAKDNSSDDFLGREFFISREFNAPRELVFDAWTNPRHLMQWWGPRGFTNPICKVAVKPGGEIYIVMRAPNGVDYPMFGEFKEIQPPDRLVFTTGALDEKENRLFEFLHEATFVDRGGKTAFTLKSKVIKTTPGAGKYIGGFEAGMTQGLEKLDELTRLTDQPLVIERTLNAPVSLVWKAITDNLSMKQWYFDLPEFRAEPGFAFQFAAGEKAVMFDHRCVVKEVVPEKRLSYSWRYEGHPGDSLVTFELTPDGNQTTLKLTHSGLHTFPRLTAFARANFSWGWDYLVGTALKNFVELK